MFITLKDVDGRICGSFVSGFRSPLLASVSPVRLSSETSPVHRVVRPTPVERQTRRFSSGQSQTPVSGPQGPEGGTGGAKRPLLYGEPSPTHPGTTSDSTLTTLVWPNVRTDDGGRARSVIGVPRFGLERGRVEFGLPPRTGRSLPK